MAASERTTAVAPPFDVRPTLQHPRGEVAVWFTDPPGAIFQFTQPARGTVALARWATHEVAEAVLQRFPRGMSIVLAFDLTLMTGRDAAARTILHERGKVGKGRIACTYVVPPREASATFINTLHVGAAVLKIFGLRVQVEATLGDVVAAGGLRPARR